MIRGMFAGVLALAALEAIVSSPAAAGRFASLLGAVSTVLDRLLDPTVAAIPNLTGTSTSAPPEGKSL